MILECFPVGPLQCNCAIIACEKTKTAMVMDPGGDVDRIVEVLEHHDLKLNYIIHTHAHIDHVLGTRELQQRCGGVIALHPGDRFLYENLEMQALMLGIPAKPVSPIEHDLDHMESLSFGEEYALVLHTPGHTPGSVCFSLKRQNPSGSAEEMLLLSGDTLFKRGIGRTDLPGGDGSQIMSSIRQRLLTLDDDTLVIPGHGPATHIGEERAKNPFLN